MAADGTDGDASLRAVADHLYGGPGARFTEERAVAAKRARDDGDRDLAARIGALPKPTAAAALLNVLARAGADDLQRVLDLGAALRDAQERGERDRLRELGGERRALLADVIERAVELSGAKRPGAAVLEEVQVTLQAALQSDDAVRALRTGRLVRALSADGLDPVDLERALAVPGVDREAVRRRSPPRHGATEDRDRQRSAERGEESRRRAAAADAAARRAADDAERARRERERTEADLREREQAADDLRARLDELRRRVDDADRATDQARSATDAAQAEEERTRDVAEAAAAEARRRREEAEPPV